MTVKSIVDIDIRDGKFREFSKIFEKYQSALKSMPQAWKAVNDKIDGSRVSFDKLVDSMVAANVQEKLREKAQERADRLTQTSADRWRSMARDAKSFAGSIKDATLNLLRWGAASGIVGGLLGAGGLFGIDRLALGVAGARRSALGLGTDYGGQQSFTANFGRLVNPESFLGSVAGAKLDVTKRVGLLGAGLSESEIAADTAQTAVSLLRRLKTIADTTNPALYGQVIQARRLDQFTSPEDLQRLRNTSPGEFNALVGAFGKNRGQLDVAGDTTARWQEFVTQMDRASKGIEATFVRGLAPLVPGLTKLSESVQKAVETLLSSDKLKGWIESFGAGIEKAAKYVGTEDFQTNIRNFVDGIAKVANAIVWLAGFIPGGGPAFNPSAVPQSQLGRTGDAPQSPGEAKMNGWMRYLGGGAPTHNPGNLRPPGSDTGFQSFPTDEAGLAAMARQIRLYQNRDKLNTIEGIITKYAPPNENNTRAYIGDVSQKTGFGAGQQLNVNDPETMARLIAAMVSNEQSKGHYDKYKDAKVVVEVLNNTGGNAAVSVNGLKN